MPHKGIYHEKESAVLDDMEKGIVGEIYKSNPSLQKQLSKIAASKTPSKDSLLQL